MNRSFVEGIIKKNKEVLSRQQIRTLKGQLNSGDIEGAYKGLNKILKKNSNKNS